MLQLNRAGKGRNDKTAKLHTSPMVDDANNTHRRGEESGEWARKLCGAQRRVVHGVGKEGSSAGCLI
jgi:hypothetical protein